MRQHVATVIGPDPVAAPIPATPRRRGADRVARPRVLVYVEGARVEVIVEPHDGASLDAAGAAELLAALATAVRVLDDAPRAIVAEDLPPAPAEAEVRASLGLGTALLDQPGKPADGLRVVDRDALRALRRIRPATGRLTAAEAIGEALVAGAPDPDRSVNAADPVAVLDALEAAGYVLTLPAR